MSGVPCGSVEDLTSACWMKLFGQAETLPDSHVIKIPRAPSLLVSDISIHDGDMASLDDTAGNRLEINGKVR